MSALRSSGTFASSIGREDLKVIERDLARSAAARRSRWKRSVNQDETVSPGS